MRSNKREAIFNPLLGRTAVDPSTPTTPEPSTPAVVKPEKVDFTVYLPVGEVDRLDEAVKGLRRELKGSKKRLTKSMVVAVALRRLLDEYASTPEQVALLVRQTLIAEG